MKRKKEKEKRESTLLLIIEKWKPNRTFKHVRKPAISEPPKRFSSPHSVGPKAWDLERLPWVGLFISTNLLWKYSHLFNKSCK